MNRSQAGAPADAGRRPPAGRVRPACAARARRLDPEETVSATNRLFGWRELAKKRSSVSIKDPVL